MMTIPEAIGLCMAAGTLGWCTSLAFYLLRRFAFMST